MNLVVATLSPLGWLELRPCTDDWNLRGSSLNMCGSFPTDPVMVSQLISQRRIAD